MRITNKFVNKTPVNYSIDGTVLTVVATNVLTYDLAELQQGYPVTINITADNYGYLDDCGVGDRRAMDVKIAPERTKQVLINTSNKAQVEIMKLRDFDLDLDVEITLWAFGMAIPVKAPARTS